MQDDVTLRRAPGSLKVGTETDLCMSCSKITEMLNKKNKSSNVKPFMVKNYLWVFVNCMIENPAFDSQVRPSRIAKAAAVVPWGAPLV